MPPNTDSSQAKAELQKKMQEKRRLMKAKRTNQVEQEIEKVQNKRAQDLFSFFESQELKYWAQPSHSKELKAKYDELMKTEQDKTDFSNLLSLKLNPMVITCLKLLLEN